MVTKSPTLVVEVRMGSLLSDHISSLSTSLNCQTGDGNKCRGTHALAVVWASLFEKSKVPPIFANITP